MSAKPPFTIGYFDDGEHRAGTGRYLAEIVGGLDRARYKPIFFSTEPRSWHCDLTELDVETVYLDRHAPSEALASPQETREMPTPTRSKLKPKLPPALAWRLGLEREIRSLERLFRMRSVDLLHSNNTGAEPGPIAAKRAGIPRVLGTFHVLPSYDLTGERSGSNFRRLERRSMAALDRAIGCCDAATRDWQTRTNFDPSIAITIHNGVDLKRIERKQEKSVSRKLLGFSNHEILIGAVGNLHSYKGHSDLLQAFSETVKSVPTARLLIAGTGPLEQELKAQAAALGIQDRIDFLGFRSDVSAVLEALDIFVQASLVEAFPMAILEASGMGIPVVATAVGGVPEAVLDGGTGLLTPPRDPQALGIALTQLANNPDLRNRMGEAGKLRVATHFTRDQMLEKILAVYEEMLSR